MPYHYPPPQLKLEICISQLFHENQCGIQVKPCWTRLGTGWVQIKVSFFFDFQLFFLISSQYFIQSKNDAIRLQSLIQ